MGKVNVRGYMRIYIGLFDHSIYYGSSDAMSIGEALLQFVDGDFKSLGKDGTYSIREFSTFHPFFTQCDPEWQRSFIEHLNQHDEDADCLSIEGLITLQQQYAGFLTALYDQTGCFDAHHAAVLLSKNEWLQNTHCFSRYSLNLRAAQQEQPVCMAEYFVSSLEDCLFLELTELLKRGIHIKTCKNCGRLFIPKRSNTDYCSRISSADGKACSEIGYTQTFARNVKNDDLLQAYTRAYKAHYARMTKPRKRTANMTREAFEAWYIEAKQKLDQARAGLIDADEFKAWLKE